MTLQLVTEKEYEQHLNKSVKQAEGAMQNVFHCLTPDCPGFCQFEDNVNEFHCDVCGKVNCLTCQVRVLVILRRNLSEERYFWLVRYVCVTECVEEYVSVKVLLFCQVCVCW